MDPHHIDAGADPDPASQNDADSCGSGSATLPPALRGIHDPDPVEKTEKSHLDVLHEKHETDLTHLEPHMHVGDTTVPFPLADCFVQGYAQVEDLQ
jgi:hypothetical protein